MTARLTRRQFLAPAAVVGAGVLAGASPLSGCGRVRSKEERIAELARSLDAALVCTDTSGLWPAEIKTRTENEYVDHSSRPDQFCLLCTNFMKPPGGRVCGTCRTVRGPINPGGWCKAFTEIKG